MLNGQQAISLSHVKSNRSRSKVMARHNKPTTKDASEQEKENVSSPTPEAQPDNAGDKPADATVENVSQPEPATDASDDTGITDVPFTPVESTSDPVTLPTGTPTGQELVEQRPEVLIPEIEKDRMAVPVFMGTGRGTGLSLVEYQKLGDVKFDEAGLKPEQVKEVKETLALFDDAMGHLKGAAEDIGRYSFQIGHAAAIISDNGYWKQFRYKKNGETFDNEEQFFNEYFPNFKYNRIRQLKKGWKHAEKMGPQFAIHALPRFLGELEARYGEMYLFSPVFDYVERQITGSVAYKAEEAAKLAGESEVEAWTLSIEQAQENARKAGKSEAEILAARPSSADVIADNAEQAIRNTLAKHKAFAGKDVFGEDGIKLPKLPAPVLKRRAARKEAQNGDNGNGNGGNGVTTSTQGTAGVPKEAPTPIDFQPPRTRQSVYKDLLRRTLGFADHLKRLEAGRDFGDGKAPRDLEWDSSIAPLGVLADKEFPRFCEDMEKYSKEMLASMAYYHAKYLREQEAEKAAKAAGTPDDKVAEKLAESVKPADVPSKETE